MGALRPGQMLEGTPYQLVREIGAGGMGVVYLVEHVRLKKQYVAKVIHEQIQNEDGAQKRMEREAQVLAGLSHPNVVQVHDVGTTQDGVAYFVMEKLDGRDLRRTMKQRGVTRTRAIEIMTDVLDALDYVHRRGVVHRDIKPENIFLAEQMTGTVTKVLDFGIVHIFDGDGRVSQGRITKTGGFVGTLYYAAPEQMQGKPAGPPNDVYAAGLVLFELLAGRGPFDDDPGVGLSRCFKPAPTLQETNGSPRDLSEVVAKALLQDPDQRPTAGALAAELRTIGAALKHALAGAAEDPIRAEVDDLLAGMAPAGVSMPAPRPAAGRAMTPAPDIGTDATAVPNTPMMAGAPQRPGHPSALEATMASEEHEPPRPVPAAGMLLANEHQPTMQGAGLAAPSAGYGAQPGHHPYAGPQTGGMAMQTGPSPQRISSPGSEQGTHAMSAPPPSPRFPPNTAGMNTPPGGQLFAMSAAPAGPRMQDAMPAVAARRGDTSPGLYATVDEPPSLPSPVVAQPPWALIGGIGGAIALVGIVFGGLALRHRAAANAPASETSMSVASTTAAPATTPPAPTASVAVAVAVAASASAASAPNGIAGAATATTAAKPASAPATAATPHVASPVVSAAKTGNTPAPAPAPARPGAKGAEKDGYVKDL